MHRFFVGIVSVSFRKKINLSTYRLQDASSFMQICYLFLMKSSDKLLHFKGHGCIPVRMLGSQSRQPGFESSCCHVEALAISFIPHCHSSLICINEYLARDRGGYLNE